MLFEYLALSLLVSGAIGSIIGLLCRGRIILQIVVGFAVSSALFLYAQLKTGTISFHWPLMDIFGGAFYLVIPSLLFSLTTVMMAIVVGQWSKRG